MPDSSILISLLLGYLLGAIPFGLILTRAAGLGDIRQVGSGNIGATNVLRTGNKRLAAATLVLDALKGTVAVLIAKLFFGDTAGLWAGLAAFVGHLFPIWLGFKGGKGVATYIGVMLGTAWPLALVFSGVWLVVALLLRTSSLAALAAAMATPFVALAGLGDHIIAWRGSLVVLTLAMSALVFIRHHANIRRLINGTEPRIGAKKPDENTPVAGS
ncbi:MAG: glycerol-3-phosphate 1-O-acyltransferase PlsY [Hyphomicrobiaceae bacterium]